MSRYTIAIAGGKPCLPGRFFLVDKHQRQAPRGALLAFRTDSRTKIYEPGTRFVKLVRGVEGDEVLIDNQGNMSIAGPDGAYKDALEPQVMVLLRKRPSDYAVRYRIPPGHYFVMGTLPDSYDSRYWGLVGPEQVVGKAVRIY